MPAARAYGRLWANCPRWNKRQKPARFPPLPACPATYPTCQSEVYGGPQTSQPSPARLPACLPPRPCLRTSGAKLHCQQAGRGTRNWGSRAPMRKRRARRLETCTTIHAPLRTLGRSSTTNSNSNPQVLLGKTALRRRGAYDRICNPMPASTRYTSIVRRQAGRSVSCPHGNAGAGPIAQHHSVQARLGSVCSMRHWTGALAPPDGWVKFVRGPMNGCGGGCQARPGAAHRTVKVMGPESRH